MTAASTPGEQHDRTPRIVVVERLSADEIDGAPVGFANNGTPVSFTPLAIDVLQVDLNAKF